MICFVIYVRLNRSIFLFEKKIDIFVFLVDLLLPGSVKQIWILRPKLNESIRIRIRNTDFYIKNLTYKHIKYTFFKLQQIRNWQFQPTPFFGRILQTGGGCIGPRYAQIKSPPPPGKGLFSLDVFNEAGNLILIANCLSFVTLQFRDARCKIHSGQV